jgi:hypothetical protein
MERRNSSAIFIILAAFAGMFAFTPRTTESRPSPVVAGQASKPTSLSTASPTPTAAADLLPAQVMIDEFYLGDKDRRRHGTVSPVQKIWPVDSIVAILPDPVESALGNQFDNFLDAIQRALAGSGYALDRFRNPWPMPALVGESSADDQKNKDSSGDSDATRKPNYTQEPGMMLFRDNVKGRLMVVFLVGETPTRGLHKSALKNALGQALQIAKTSPAPSATNPDAGASGVSIKNAGSRIKVMGPSFSGSAVSMNFALRSWLTDPKSSGVKGIDIISGSATAINKKEFLKDLNAVDYHTTVFSDDYVINRLLDWLKLPQGDGVAILAEESTAYGTVVKEKRQNKSANPSLAPHSLRLYFPAYSGTAAGDAAGANELEGRCRTGTSAAKSKFAAGVRSSSNPG